MQNLGLSVPFLSAGEGKKQAELLAEALQHGSQKAAEVGRDTEESFEMMVLQQLQDAKLAIQLVRDDVLAESPYGEIHLSDPEIQSSILILEQELGKASERLGTLKRLNLAAKSEKREEILRRFG